MLPLNICLTCKYMKFLVISYELSHPKGFIVLKIFGNLLTFYNFASNAVIGNGL